MTSHPTSRRWVTVRRPVGRWMLLLVLEAALVVGYFTVSSDAPADEIRYLVYPFVWINAGVWAVTRVEPNPRTRRHRLFAGAIAAAYLLLVLYLPGNVGLGGADVPVTLRVEMYAPGWGPILAFTSPWLRLFLVPFEVIGYGALSYLLFVTVLDVTRGVLSGVFGLVTCVGCTVPVVVTLTGVLGGPVTSLTTTAYAWSYDVGTLVFLLTVGLLYWSHRRERRRNHPD